MAFVKLDSGLLLSSLWVERDQRSLFVTALLMAEPFELREPAPQLAVRSLERTGWLVPIGWYGRVGAAGVGIVRTDGLDREQGLAALEILGNPDPESRSHDFEGRRLVRIDGGYLVLNYMKYRDYDYTAAERQQRLRDRKKKQVGSVSSNENESGNETETVSETVPISETLASDVTRDNNVVTRDSNAKPSHPPQQSRIAEGRRQKAELEASSSSEIELGLFAKVPTVAGHDALDAVLGNAQSREGCAATLALILSGDVPNLGTPTVEQFVTALQDFAADGNRFNALFFRAFVKRAMAKPTDAPSASSVSGRHTNGTPSPDSAAVILARIRELVESSDSVGNGVRKFIRRERVEALGADVLKAYDGLGGFDRIRDCKPESAGFLVRDFQQLLDDARRS